MIFRDEDEVKRTTRLAKRNRSLCMGWSTCDDSFLDLLGRDMFTSGVKALVSFATGGGGTFTRASEASYFTRPPTADGTTAFLDWAASNVIREDKRDGVSGGYLFERAVTNFCLWSEDYTQASWVKVGGTTISGTTANAPDGAADCNTVSFTAAATDEINQVIAGTANATVYSWNVWVRKPSGAGTVRLRVVDRAALTTTTADLAVGTTWTRLSQSLNWGTGASAPEAHLLNGTAATAQDLQVWGAAVMTGVASVVGLQPQSYIRTSGSLVSSSQDRLTFATTPATMRSGRWTFRHAPQGDSTTHAGDQCPYEFEGATFASAINAKPTVNGSGTVRKTSVIVMGRGPAITYSADQIVSYTVDMPNGAVTIAGATTGNGTGYAAPPAVYADGLMEVGGVGGGAWANARIWEPFAAPPVTWIKQLDFTTGTYTRALEAGYHNAPPNTTGGFLSWAAANTIREDKRDGLSKLFLFEPTRSNLCLFSEDFTNAAWVKTGATVSGTTANAPDGEADCNTISFTAAADNVTQAIAGTLDANTYASTVWVRSTSGAGNIRLRTVDRNAVSTTTADIPITTTWSRIEQIISWGTGASAPTFGIVNDVAGTTQSIEVWGTMVERTLGAGNNVSTSTIRTTTVAVTRNTDSLTFASVPAAMQTTGFRFAYRPHFTNAENVVICPAFGFDAAADTYEGAASGATLTAVLAGVSKFNKTALTWARDQAMTVCVDNGTFVLSVAGALTGDGIGSVGLACGTGTTFVRVGSTGAGSRQMNGRIGEPYAAP